MNQELVGKACIVFNVDSTDLISQSQERKCSLARGAIGYLVKNSEEGSITKLAGLLKRDSSTISSLVTRFEQKLQTDADIKSKVEEIQQMLNLTCN